MTDWATVDLRFFRLSKHYVNLLFDGQPHLLRRDVDFPGVMANSDISRRVRNAAYYRKVKVVVTPTPDGLLVQSNRDKGEGVDEKGLAEQLFKALEDRDVMEEALQMLGESLGTRVATLEQEVSFLKEELSLLKIRQPRSVPN